MSRARVAGVVLAVAACLAPGTAHATEVSASELERLAQDGSPGAVRELRAVTSVDGQPVGIDAALGNARDEELEARLEALADLPAAGDGVGDARAEAREILAQDRFNGDEVPGPFGGIVDFLESLVPDDLIAWIDDVVPGSRSVVWIVLGTLLLVTGFLIGRRLLSSRIRASESAALAFAPAEDDPRALERRAEEAEARGELEAALRLRFRAGLLRLDRRGAIEFRPSISTHEVRRAVRSDDFDRLAATFDDVVYGGREAEGEDVAEARERWPEVLK
ncbi:DUF4129 domain-containing protein [Solirubrobacter sp. CPCC 204708]|uniref:DUF4129 domain-containing protein n=1 Tax=Solirubrobacter deserti TaxID=2282478 RepID=A0ABT4RMX0_9ACTN|nr:DUF4129 domain-containing protein [Solirubrobacter deserti]MBE2320164.1 DUF4129 domain-containing protein [Solirubrobacter deserti]MDA0139884.1 DUF4129 domain-containing protein [Solirubrobacter deserti]